MVATEPPAPSLVETLRDVCQAVASGQYDAVDRVFALADPRGGEAAVLLAELGEAFGLMVVQLEVREEHQKQLIAELEEAARRLREAQSRLHAENAGLRRQMTSLEVQIDQTGRQRAVSEIVESDFFVALQTRARDLRRRGQEGG